MKKTAIIIFLYIIGIVLTLIIAADAIYELVLTWNGMDPWGLTFTFVVIPLFCIACTSFAGCIIMIIFLIKKLKHKKGFRNFH